MNSVASLISQGHQERQQEQSFPHRDQKSFQTASSDLSFVGKTRLAPSPTVVGNDFTSEVSIIIIEKFLPTAFCSSARPLHAVPSAGVTTACIHCALRVISDLL